MNNGPARLLTGFVIGAGVAAVDNFAVHGEVSPIIIVAMLLAVAAAIGSLWDSAGFISALLTWAWLPLTHIVKHIYGMPDTLYPNTYQSIAMLAAFSAMVTCVGFAVGMAVYSLRKNSPSAH